VNASIVTPSHYIGTIMDLSTDKRGIFDGMEYLDEKRVVMSFQIPLAELIVDYFDQLKSRTQGYASLDRAQGSGRNLASKLKELIPRQMFEVPIQAAIGGTIIARETVKAVRKNVLAKCYGGDITRKKKLLEKQKEGKERMKRVGSVEIPQEAFLAVLRTDSD
jgi:GTP-binding protein LepA